MLELNRILKEQSAKWMIWEGKPIKESTQRLKAIGIHSHPINFLATFFLELYIRYKTYIKTQTLPCFCQSTILWRDENCRFAGLIPNFANVLILDISAILLCVFPSY